MKKITTVGTCIAVCAAIFLLGGCGEEDSDDLSPVHTPPTVATDANRALYDQHCYPCHTTSMIGVGADRIAYAIAANKGGMGSLGFLTSSQIQSISEAR